MPLVYQQNINEQVKLAVWHITEAESFFLEHYTPTIQINNSQKRIQHLAGRYLLKHLAGDFSLQNILISKSGMPYLSDGSSFFSISHCDEHAAVIWSQEQSVGIDIEAVKNKVAIVKDKFLIAEELLLLKATNVDSIVQYTIGWTIKEAMYKWYGLGNVDFRKNLVIQSFEQKSESFIFEVLFLKDEICQSLKIKTTIFQNKVLSWLVG